MAQRKQASKKKEPQPRVQRPEVNPTFLAADEEDLVVALHRRAADGPAMSIQEYDVAASRVGCLVSLAIIELKGGPLVMAQRKKAPAKRQVPRAPNPPQLTEDEEDGIMMKRLLATEKPIPLQKVLDRYGYTVER